MPRRSPHWILAGILTLAFAAPARALPFDLIWADHLTITNPGIGGFSLSSDVLLLVNTGTTDITSTDLASVAIRTQVSDPAVTAIANIENPVPPYTPIHPNEAAGRITAFNGVLTSKLLLGETLRTAGTGPVFSFLMRFPPGFLGSLVLDFTMTLGGDQARYSMLVEFIPGVSFQVAFPSASRVSSVPLATASAAATWGRVKALYR